MLGNFTYCSPTRLYFGENSLDSLEPELKKYGNRILLIYGGEFIKKHGLYDQIVKILRSCGKTIIEIPGIMPNPTVEMLYKGCEIARESNISFILAVGGSSVCDYAKVLSASVWCKDSPWEKYFLRRENVNNRIIPVGCVLTTMGTGSEANACAYLTNHSQKLKIGRNFGENVIPRFSILNPELTYTLHKHQMAAGIYSVFSPVAEQYLFEEDDNTLDFLTDLMKSVIRNSLIVSDHPENYAARCNIMWTAAWALNPAIARGEFASWMLQRIGQSISAYTDAAHGMAISSISIPYYYNLMPCHLEKFKQFATNVWGVVSDTRSDSEIATAGLQKMENWMRKLGLVMSMGELGVTEDILDSIIDHFFAISKGRKTLNRREIIDILKESL